MTSRSIKLLQEAYTNKCSYLDGQESRNVFIDPSEEVDQHLLDTLNINGFRRSGDLLYRPNCPECTGCKATRVLSDEFAPSKSQKRILNRNKDLTLSVAMPQATEEVYALYERYINLRHFDGDMYPPSPEQFNAFLCKGFGNTRFLLAHENDELVACMVFDILSDSLSAVYCFFEAEDPKRSLGSFMILSLTRLTQALDMPYHYLGYWVSGSPKMDYKKNYQPLEVFMGDKWEIIT